MCWIFVPLGRKKGHVGESPGLVYGGGHMMPFVSLWSSSGSSERQSLCGVLHSREPQQYACFGDAPQSIHMKFAAIVAPFGGRHAQF